MEVPVCRALPAIRAWRAINRRRGQHAALVVVEQGTSQDNLSPRRSSMFLFQQTKIERRGPRALDCLVAARPRAGHRRSQGDQRSNVQHLIRLRADCALIETDCA